MEPRQLLDFLGVVEKLKCSLRHGWTSTGRRESVAEHSWRIAVMALLLEDQFPGVDMQRVIRICLVHDWGEAVTGDIPTFYKTEKDEVVEQRAIDRLLCLLPDELRQECDAMLDEFESGSTEEGRLARTIDKLEAVLQHNEADISTWIPLEYELNVNHATKEASRWPYLERLRALMREDSIQKIDAERRRDKTGELQDVGTVTLDTERLTLRRLTPDDAPVMFRNWASDPEVTKYLTWPTHADVGMTRSYLEMVQKELDDNRNYNWGIVLKETGEPVGAISVVDRDDSVKRFHIGYCLGRSCWNKGIMSEALAAVMEFLFTQVGALRIDSCHDVNNPASGRVMQKCGMKHEGTLRGHGRNNQGIVDVAWYGITKEDYESLVASRGGNVVK